MNATIVVIRKTANYRSTKPSNWLTSDTLALLRECLPLYLKGDALARNQNVEKITVTVSELESNALKSVNASCVKTVNHIPMMTSLTLGWKLK